MKEDKLYPVHPGEVLEVTVLGSERK